MSRINVCSFCASKFSQLLGETAMELRSTVVDISPANVLTDSAEASSSFTGNNSSSEDNARSNRICAACLGLFQFAQDHAKNIFECVKKSPYASCDKRLTPQISAPRQLSFWWLLVAFVIAARKNKRAVRGDGASVIPAEFCNFRNLFAAVLRQTLFKSCDEFLGPSGFSFNSSPNGVIIDLEVSHGPTADVMQKLPTALVSNRCDEDLTWRHVIQPFLSDAADVSRIFSEEDGARASVLDKLHAHVDCVVQLSTPISNSSVAADVDYSNAAAITITLSHATVFLGGNYCKYSRSMPQSPWFCDGERVGGVSLQEEIAAKILPFFFPTGENGTAAEGEQHVVPPNDVTATIMKSFVAGSSSSSSSSSSLSCQLHVPKRRPKVQTAERRVENEGDEDDEARRWRKGGQFRDISKQQTIRPTGYQQDVDPMQVSRELVFGFDQYKFHSAGREDVDVRMLGAGRPFLLEVISPYRGDFTAQQFAEMERLFSDRLVEVSKLHIIGDASKATLEMARHSESKRKKYRCVVWTSHKISGETIKKVEALRDFKMAQKTPLRVLHRRSLLTREKIVHSIGIERVNDHWLVVDLETAAGAYVKEFIHGDMGRTTPSFAELLGDGVVTDIIQLDVAEIEIKSTEEEKK